MQNITFDNPLYSTSADQSNYDRGSAYVDPSLEREQASFDFQEQGYMEVTPGHAQEASGYMDVTPARMEDAGGYMEVQGVQDVSMRPIARLIVQLQPPADTCASPFPPAASACKILTVTVACAGWRPPPLCHEHNLYLTACHL